MSPLQFPRPHLSLITTLLCSLWKLKQVSKKSEFVTIFLSGEPWAWQYNITGESSYLGRDPREKPKWLNGGSGHHDCPHRNGREFVMTLPPEHMWNMENVAPPSMHSRCATNAALTPPPPNTLVLWETALPLSQIVWAQPPPPLVRTQPHSPVWPPALGHIVPPTLGLSEHLPLKSWHGCSDLTKTPSCEAGKVWPCFQAPPLIRLSDFLPQFPLYPHLLPPRGTLDRHMPP